MRKEIELALKDNRWTPHELYSVFTQYDKSYYLTRYNAFLKKYRLLNTIANYLKPKSIIELGCCAGSAADAFLSAVPEAKYLGIDIFGLGTDEFGKVWNPFEVIQALFKDRGYKSFALLKQDLRKLHNLSKAELVFVDAKHDAYSAYQDILLALTASPRWILCDDSQGSAREGIANFQERYKNIIQERLDFNSIGGLTLFVMKEVK